MTRFYKQFYCITIFVFFSISGLKAQIEFPESVGDSIVLDTIALNVPDKIEAAEGSIRKKLQSLENAVHLKLNKTVEAFINMFVNNKREYVSKVAFRQQYYFPIFEHYLKKHNLPQELKYLAIVESALQPKAQSWASAVGLWQFIPSTGRSFRLRQDAYIDERMDVHKSTEAACLYLKQLYEFFGNWELALASYNCGPGFVRRAIRNSGNKTDFWAIYNYLPRETRSYVPMFVAVMYVMNDLDSYKIEPYEDILFLPESDTIMVNNPVNLTLLAKQLNVNAETLQDLNPHIKRDIIPPYFKNCIINIPKTATENFMVNRSEIMDSVSKVNFVQPIYVASTSRKRNNNYYSASILPSFSIEGLKRITYIVRSGDLLMNIAAQYNVSIPAIKAWNGMRSNIIWAGQKLALYIKQELVSLTEKKDNPLALEKVSRPEHENKKNDNPILVAVKEQPKEVKVSKSETTEKKKVRTNHSHIVKVGDTLWNISQRYGMKVEELKKLNNILDNKLKVGQELIVVN